MKELLVVVDYQNDFVSGSLGFEKAASLEDTICHKIEAYRSRGADVVFTFDTHDADYLDTQEGKCLPVVHCVRGTPGWQLCGRVAGY
ncbi:cysteine hydrolase family protein [Anaerotruncus colihominis]